MNIKNSLPKSDFVRLGWFALHEAVLNSGALLNTASHENWKEFVYTNWVDSEIYIELLKPIVEITGVKIETPSVDGDLIGKEIWQQLRKLKKKYAHKPSNSFVRTSVHGLCGEFSDWKEKPLAIRNSKIYLYDPLPAANIGWSLIELANNSNKYFPDSLFWGLALLGWVYKLYCHVDFCPLCFRWTVPNSKYCFMHSQSGSVAQHIGASKTFIQYRKGVKTLELASNRNLTIKNQHPIANDAYINSILAEYLFFNNPSEVDILDLHYALTISPRVIKKLGGSDILKMGPKQLLEYVRTEINPIEFFPTVLALNILYYEKILILEDVQPGRPKGKPSPNTQIKIQKYIELSKRGLKRSTIIKILGISKSTISNWLKRYPDMAFE